MRPFIKTVGIKEPWPPWVIAFLVHVVSSIFAIVLHAFSPVHIPAVMWLWIQGIGAAGAGAMAGLPRWWLPINLLFLPALDTLLGLQVPPTFFLVVFGFIFVVNVAAWRHRVPFFLSSSKAAATLVSVLPRQDGIRLIDLGCGTGSLLVDLAEARPDGYFHGVETAPLSFLFSWWRARRRSAIQVSWDDFWHTDLAQYDVVFAYLSPTPMTRLWEKARCEMRPGSLLVSNTFVIPGILPTRIVPVDDSMHSVLYIWRM